MDKEYIVLIATLIAALIGVIHKQGMGMLRDIKTAVDKTNDKTEINGKGIIANRTEIKNHSDRIEECEKELDILHKRITHSQGAS